MKPGDDLDTDLRRQLVQALQSAIWPAVANADAPALTIAPAAKPQAPAKLAAAHGGSAKARTQACQIYERCLAMYRAKLRPDDKADDLGAAVAFFVLVNYLALHRRHFDDRAGLIDAEPEALVGQIARQLQHLLGGATGWESASAVDKQTTFEQFAILGVYVAEASALAARQGTAAVEHVRQAAARYLRELLGVAPERLHIGDNGLKIRIDPIAP
jgi:hypothetical protein